MASPITTHILDTSLGKPAAGVPVLLERSEGQNAWKELGRKNTDSDGRVKDLLEGSIMAGVYRLTFDTHEYFLSRKLETFYPTVQIVFEIKDTASHYHVPLLVSPFGYSTYRGS